MRVIRWNQALGKNLAFHISRETKHGENAVTYHGHDFSEVFWVDEGHGQHRVNGELLPLLTGQMVFIRATDCHGIELRRSHSLKLTNIAFRLKTLQFIRERYFPGLTRWFWSEAHLPTVLPVEPRALAELAQIADRLAGDPRERFYIERFLMNLIYRIELRETAPIPPHAPDWLLNACRKIEAPEYLQQGVQGFVKLAGRCHEHVSRVTQECLGVSPSDFVNRIRMRYAAAQLEMTDRPIIEIAMDCGLPNLSHFYKVFRNAHKLSPRRYRMARQGLN